MSFCTASKLVGLMLLVLLVGCGGGSDANQGGEGGGSPTAPVTPTTPTASLSGATSFSQFVNQVMPLYFNATTVDRLKLYDNDFSSFPETTMLLLSDGSRPFGIGVPGSSDTWTAYVAPGQGFANTWPDQPNADITFTGTANSRIMGYSAVDRTNGQVGEGEARAYWGIRNINPSQSPHLPIVIVIEQIVRNNNIPQYRAISAFEGVLLLPITPVTGGGTIGPALGMRGQYSLFAVEAFNGGVGTGQLLNYRACWMQVGFVSAGYQPSGNWCT